VQRKNGGIDMNIGNQIKSFRLEKKVTQEEFAGFLGISPQAVSKWETGASTPDISLLPEIATYFGVTIDELFKISDEEQLERIKNMHWRVRRIPQETFEQSVQFLNHLLLKNPEDVNAFEGLAYLYNSRAKSDHDEASVYAKKVLELEPERKSGLVAYLEANGGACGDEWYDNHFEIIQFFKNYLRKYPKNGQVMRALITNLLDDERYKEAVPYIAELEKIKEGPNIQIYYGDVAYGCGDYKRARELWDKAVEKYPDKWQSYCFRADRLKKIGQTEEAIEDYQKCVQMQEAPHFLDGLYSIAQLHEMAENYQAAIDDYKQILFYLEKDYQTTSGESVDAIIRKIERLSE